MRISATRKPAAKAGLAHRPVPRLQAAIMLAALSVGSAAWAQSAQFEEDFDDPYKPWQEIAIQLPAPPQPENLLPFEVSGNATHRFAVDAQSVNVGTDGVVRYTLVTMSSAGARNVSYEGLRCNTGEVKLYAFGHPDGSWSRSRRDQWQSIRGNQTNRHHAVLAREFICQERTIAGNASQIVFRIRNGQSLAPALGD
ncbi:MAG TPA: CNP1-like family protein [Noviherbaspirillum sp.]|nr:CNP1-like family protein [Noviherbaspirillum sp.]